MNLLLVHHRSTVTINVFNRSYFFFNVCRSIVQQATVSSLSQNQRWTR